MKLSSGYEKKKARIEMLPLIDIVFLLLIFFIFAMLSMTVHQGLRVQLPEASTAQPDKRDHVDITITGENEVLVNEIQVSLDNLIEEVLLNEGRQYPVFISGDRRADLGLAIQVLDRLRKAGIKDVTFQTREEAK
ncbi:MAG: biopolymer transporter ExbD [Deltaproteobacteria bacterium]|nr:biopolymer transporter ExbD [Deltaproteobacteria bacterium]MBW2051656.1 biopolymer transporter ExbD [Deltaproteobacteria bacterium]MBW2140229.1 biopolymer transporter ExbD [Deltaproteobacteria bacterium]MBW2323967.1 biopolymer transporter ExbD [Deltaproteobacteria bacterium]